MTLPTTANTHSFAVAAAAPPTLRDLLEDGIYLLFLLRDGNAPVTPNEFNHRLDQFLDQFERTARSFGKSADAVQEAKYAFCALVDEMILSSDFAIRPEWERMPLQLRLFGDHLAGEAFFDRLDALRTDPAKNIDTLEIYYTCLLLGFRGKYLLEGIEKLAYLVHRIGQEISHIRGSKAEFAPNWRLPHRFPAYVRNELPIWLFYAIVGLVGTGVFLSYRLVLNGQVANLFGT